MCRGGAEWNDGGGHSAAMCSCHPVAPLEPIWLGQPLPLPAVPETGMKATKLPAETPEKGGLRPKLSAEYDVGFECIRHWRAKMPQNDRISLCGLKA